MASRDCTLTWVRQTAAQREQEQCTLLNLGYGGMRFVAQHPLHEGEVYKFLIDLGLPVRSPVHVTARIRWVRPSGVQGYDAGAMFLDSSRGWLGPPENESE